MATLKQSALIISMLFLKSAPALASHILPKTSIEEGGSLILIQPQHHKMFRKEIVDSFIQRQKVFLDKLKWDIPVE